MGNTAIKKTVRGVESNAKAPMTPRPEESASDKHCNWESKRCSSSGYPVFCSPGGGHLVYVNTVNNSNYYNIRFSGFLSDERWWRDKGSIYVERVLFLKTFGCFVTSLYNAFRVCLVVRCIKW